MTARRLRLTRLGHDNLGVGLTALAFVALACASGEPPAAALGTFGPDGGTLVGPSGAMVSVPAGAVPAGTSLGIAVATDGYPPLPASLRLAGAVYAFTPHGTAFAAPVAIRVPFDAGDPRARQLALYTAPPAGAWTVVREAAAAGAFFATSVGHFSFFFVAGPVPADAAVDALAPGDALGDAAPPPPPVDPASACGATHLFDLAAQGLARIGDTRIVTPVEAASSTGLLPAPATCGAADVVAEIAYRYTVKATSRLLVRADFEDGLPGPALAVWILDTCHAGATDHGCTTNDNLTGAGQSAGWPVSVTSAGQVAAGSTVFILVGLRAQKGLGRSEAMRLLGISVQESREVSPGEACDFNLHATVCAAGSRCTNRCPSRQCKLPSGQTNHEVEDVGLCRTEGTFGNPCRLHGAACDPGLACSGPPDGEDSRCWMVRQSGESCNRDRAWTVCAADLECAQLQGLGQCRSAGASGTHCRQTDPRCDAGLVCDPGLPPAEPMCWPTAAPGQICNESVAPKVFCPAGQSCSNSTTSPPAPPACVPIGAMDGACRTTGAPCDQGLGCRDGSCYPLVVPGNRCESGAQGHTACPAGMTCGWENGFTCVADGAVGGACRTGGAPCDAGALCDTDHHHCVAKVALGADCYPQGFDACGPGATCRDLDGPSNPPKCAADGSALGKCRASGAPCDAGLLCDVEGALYDICRPPSACTVARQTGACAPPSVCTSSGGPITCVPPGKLGGACGGVLPPCEPSLTCDGARCVPFLAPGAACAQIKTTCPPGTTCGVFGPATCVLAGAKGGLCRRFGPACDAGLACNEPEWAQGWCVPAVAAGGGCDYQNPSAATACVPGTSCRMVTPTLTDPHPNRCLADGANGGLCRPMAPRCEAGLVCRSDGARFSPLDSPAREVCQPAVAAGATCDTTHTCAEGFHCTRPAMGICKADGELGGLCRLVGDGCAPGLPCVARTTGPPVCAQPIPDGAPCDPSDDAKACSPPARCIASGGAGTCGRG
jgi:hypothetical protein